MKYGNIEYDSKVIVIIHKGHLNDSKYLSIDFYELDYFIFEKLSNKLLWDTEVLIGNIEIVLDVNTVKYAIKILNIL